MKLLKLVVLVLTLLGSSRSVSAQAKTAVPGEELTVYLMTMEAGDAVFEKFGHTAIWIHNATTQRDIAYNWGLFDFNDADFIPRLARGNMRYSMAGFEMREMLQWYIDQKRKVWAQELNLSPEQRMQVQALAELNALPQNRFYTYDYYLNNCSTLPRDIIDEVVSGAVKRQTDSTFANTTFRSHTLRLIGGDKLAFAGAQFALGHPADGNITLWQEMFLPLKLREHITKVTVPGKTGAMEPFVLREIDLASSTRPGEPAAAPNYLTRFTLYGLGISALLLILLSLSIKGVPATKVLLGIVASLWSIIAGFAGLGLMLAWTVTNHIFMHGNENILQLNPLLLVLGVLMPFAFRIGRLRRTVMGIALACAVLSVLGFVLQALPSLDQPNGEIIGLAMPVNLTLVFVCWFLFSGRMKRT